MRYLLKRLLPLVLALLLPALARAGEVIVAVAANFTAPMRELARQFEERSGHRVNVSFGSTGKLYAQIVNGAPYDLFLAADRERPRRLHEEGLAEAPRSYAIGTLVLWSPDPTLIDDQAAVLNTERFRHLAITNPKTAPYGAAAMQVLESLGLQETLRPRLVRGDNTAQSYQFVITGNAELGFVALSQVVMNDAGSRWFPPQASYEPLRQDAVLLARGRDNGAARELLAFLFSEDARAEIRRFGYGLD